MARIPVQSASKPTRTLRVCNAYASPDLLDVALRSVSLLDGRPMQFKSCRDVRVKLELGDTLDFKLGFLSASAFTISSLPDNATLMLLAIYRADPGSAAVSFESHVFSAESREDPQVAVIDLYRGSAVSELLISEANASEHLQFNSSVLLAPGGYSLALKDGDVQKMQRPFVALKNSSYVLLRTGCQGGDSADFEEDLVVFPESKALENVSPQLHPSRAWLLAVLALRLGL